MRVLAAALALLVLIVGTSAAASSEDYASVQADRFGFGALERAGEPYTGSQSIREGLNVDGVLDYFRDTVRSSAGDLLRGSLRSGLLILSISLFFSLSESVREGTGGDPMDVGAMAASLAVTAVAVGDIHSVMAMGEETIFRMESLGDVLLPAVTMAAAAGGSPAGALAREGAAILFSDALIHLIRRLLIPLCYAFVALSAAWAALGNDGLKRIGGLVKWLCATLLSAFLLVYIAYLNLSGVIAGGADAATVKAAKFTISNLVPVVGGVISDTAETLLAGAAVLRNAAGVFGMLAVVGICLLPFLRIGLHYLLYRCTAALAAVVAGKGRLSGLIEDLSAAFGLVLAMTGSCAALLLIAMIASVSSVSV